MSVIWQLPGDILHSVYSEWLGWKDVSRLVKGSNEDWAFCLSHVLTRRQYKKVTLQLKEDYYHPVESLRSVLEEYEILETNASEATLISLLQDLPHLDCLYLRRFDDNHYTDATFAAIIQHVAKSLTKFEVVSGDMDMNGFSRFDRFMSELIKKCELLTSLTICRCGLESLVAVSKHSSLRLAVLTTDPSVPEEMLDGLLLDEKVMWPSTLEIAAVISYMRIFAYEFNEKSRHWSKQGM
eukprot:scaffold622_cov174-Ochromonas_danica.AAC.11